MNRMLPAVEMDVVVGPGGRSVPTPSAETVIVLEPETLKSSQLGWGCRRPTARMAKASSVRSAGLVHVAAVSNKVDNDLCRDQVSSVDYSVVAHPELAHTPPPTRQCLDSDKGRVFRQPSELRDDTIRDSRIETVEIGLRRRCQRNIKRQLEDSSLSATSARLIVLPPPATSASER